MSGHQIAAEHPGLPLILDTLPGSLLGWVRPPRTHGINGARFARGVGLSLFPFLAAPSSSHVQRLHPRPNGRSRQDFLSPPAHLQETGLPDLRMGQGILNAVLGTWRVGLRRVEAARGFQQPQPPRSTTIVVRREMNNSEGKTRSYLYILLERESISHNERLACLSHHLVCGKVGGRGE